MIFVYDNSNRPKTDPPNRSDGVLGAWRTLKYNCTRLRPQQHRVYTRVWLSLIRSYTLEPYPWFHSAPPKYLPWSRLACMLRSRCLPPSPRSAPSSKLSPLYVPVSPVSRADRCKPCPVALVPTLGCSRPLPPSLLLLACALSGKYYAGVCLLDKVKTVLTFGHV